jgi:hypothetical protein
MKVCPCIYFSTQSYVCMAYNMERPALYFIFLVPGNIITWTETVNESKLSSIKTYFLFQEISHDLNR